MINTDILKFRDLLSSDSECQEKLKAAVEAYTGEQDEKSVFDNLLLPLAKEYGLSATYDEFKEFTGALVGGTEDELSEDELAQIAGGKDSGYGFCFAVGGGDMFGAKSSYAPTDMSFYACEAIGVGFCFTVGGV